MDHETITTPTTDEYPARPSVKNPHPRLKKLCLIICCLIVLAACSYGAYTWQHHKVTTQSVTIDSLSTNTTKVEKLNTSMRKQVGQLQKQLQVALSPQDSSTSSTTSTTPTSSTTSSSTPATQIQLPTSSLVITGIKTVPITTYAPDYVPPAGGATTYEEVDFTIYNNSDSTQTYSTQDNNTYIKGVTSTGTVVESYFSGADSYQPWQATVLPGGSTNGLALFHPTDGVVKLQWLAPDSTTDQPTYIILPS